MFLSCNDPSLGNILSIFRNIINLILIISPILLIISLTYGFIQMMNNPEDKKFPKKIFNSCMALVVVFFIPLLVNVVLIMLGESNDISACYNSKSTANYDSSYIDTSDGEKVKIINDDNYESGVKKNNNSSGNSGSSGNSSVDDNTPISNDLNGLFAAAKKADRHTYSRGYHYNDAVSFDGTDMLDASGKRSVSCDRGVGLTLYFFGYRDVNPNTLNLGALTNYLPKKGWKRINSCNALKPGDVVFYDRNHNGVMDATDHTFLIGESINLRYDWGSNASIQHTGNFSGGMPYTVQINCNEFGWAYRMP